MIVIYDSESTVPNDTEGGTLWNAYRLKALHVSCPVLSGIIFDTELE